MDSSESIMNSDYDELNPTKRVLQKHGLEELKRVQGAVKAGTISPAEIATVASIYRDKWPCP